MRNIDFWFEPASCAFRLLNRKVTVLCRCFKDTGNYIYRVISQTKTCVLHAKSVVMFPVSFRQQTAIVCTLGDLAISRLFAVHLFVLPQSTSPALAWQCHASGLLGFSPCEIQACGGLSGTVAISLPALLFHLSVSFNRCCLFVCILILILAEGQAGEGWERSDKAMLLGEGWGEMCTGGCVTVQLHLCRCRQMICFAATESSVSNDQALCFTVMNRPYNKAA